MKNKRNIFLFVVWTISLVKSIPIDYRYVSKTRLPSKPRYTTTWAFNVPNPMGPFGPFLPDLSEIYRYPMQFPYPNSFFHPGQQHPSHYPFPNFENPPSQFPFDIETIQKPHLTNFVPESQFTQEVESTTIKEVFNNIPVQSNNQKHEFTNFEVQSSNMQEINNNAILIDSLNKALNKLNNLLPHKEQNKNATTENMSTTQNPAIIKPEVLAESLNKAIDMLTDVLAMKPSESQNLANYPPFFGEHPLVPVINPQQMSLSLESAIKELEKLFTTLPDELKNPQGNKKPNNPIGPFQPIFVPRPIIPAVMKPLNVLPETTEFPIKVTNSHTEDTKVNEVTTPEPITLFTSSTKIKNKEPTTTESVTLFTSSNNFFTSSNNLFTSSNNLFTSSKLKKNNTEIIQKNTTPMTSESSEEIGLFTSSPKDRETTKKNTTPTAIKTTISNKESEDMLFTIEKNTTPSVIETTISNKDSEDMLFTSSPKRPSEKSNPNVGITEKIEKITSSPELISNKSNETIKTATRINVVSSTDKQSSESNLNTQTETTNEVTFIDIRFGNEPRSDDSIVFPDDFDDFRKPDRISPSFIHENELGLASRFGDSNSTAAVNLEIQPSQSTSEFDNKKIGFMLPMQNPFLIISNRDGPSTQQNGQINLQYNPQRPSFQPEPLVYPMPIIRPGEPLPGSSTERNNNQQLGDRNNVPSTTTTQRTVTSKPNENTPISLEYKPSRPFYAPNPIVYPMPMIPPGEPLPGSSTERNNNQQLGDRNNVPSTTTTQRTSNENTPISLEYKPSRPFFAPNPIVYPMPIIPPGVPLPGSSTERNNNQQLGDRNNVPSTTTQRISNENTPISLEYKPSRPPFAPNPVVYPMPQNFEQLGDRNEIPTTHTTPTSHSTTRTTKKPYANTPIVLGYKPSRPPYVPNPWIYPSPGLIPPGTPWPASSTERPLGK